MIEPIVKRCAGLDVHKMQVTVTALIEQEDGSVEEETREFKTFRKHRKQLCRWLIKLGIDLAIMKSTGNYWRSIHDSLEAAGIPVWVVNARHLKQVPGKKTDVLDSKWLAMVGRMGLVRPSFVPSKDFRELRLITRQRQMSLGLVEAFDALRSLHWKRSKYPIYFKRLPYPRPNRAEFSRDGSYESKHIKGVPHSVPQS